MIKNITGNRLDKYNIISDIEFLLQRNYASSPEDALKVDDIYLILSQCMDIEKRDIDRKISEAISKLKI